MTGGRRLAFLAVLVSIGLLAPTPSAAGAGPVPGEIALRVALGLSTDALHLAAVHADPSGSAELGIPLDAEEAADVRRRAALQDEISEYKQTFQTRSGFAGFYVDQKGGGELVIMVTSPAQESAVAWANARPEGTSVRIEVVSRTYDELVRLAARINADRAQLMSRGVELNSVWVDEPANQVVVTAHPLTDDMRKIVRSTYPDVTVVDEPPPELAACVSRSNCTNPLRAGIWVTFSGGGACTSNFVARNAGSTLDIYLITAGHCALLSERAYHNGVQIGNVVRRDWRQEGFTDSLAIDVTESQKSNLVYLTNESMLSITSRQSPTADYIGQIICQSGAVSTIRCGTLVNTDEAAGFGGVLLYHVRRVNGMVVQHGDSGAPTTVYQTGKATGLVMGSNYSSSNPIGWYTHVYWSEYFLNLSICKSMTCPL